MLDKTMAMMVMCRDGDGNDNGDSDGGDGYFGVWWLWASVDDGTDLAEEKDKMEVQLSKQILDLQDKNAALTVRSSSPFLLIITTITIITVIIAAGDFR